MKHLLSYLFISIFLLLSLSVAPIALLQPAHAQTTEESICTGSGGSYANGACTGGTTRTVGGTFSKIANILIFLVGAVSVIMIIIGGLRYAFSGGDQSTISSAKNTILYAIIGIIVAAAAYAIVKFVLGNI